MSTKTLYFDESGYTGYNLLFEDRQDLLGHKTGKVEASNRVCGEESRKTPALTLIRTARYIASR